MGHTTGDFHEFSTLYADSAPVFRTLRITLYFPDWCEFEKQSFYQELMEYIHSLETRSTPQRMHMGPGGRDNSGKEVDSIAEKVCKKETAVEMDTQRRLEEDDKEAPVSIPYTYLGEIQMNFFFAKAAVGFSFLSLVISLITLLVK